MAARVLARVTRDDAFAAAALDAELARAVQLEARDRGLATELAYGALRVLPWLETRLAREAPRGIDGLEPRARAHLTIAAYQLFFLERVPAFAAVSEAVDGVREVSGAKVAGFANAVLRKLARAASIARGGEPGLATLREQAIVSSASPWLHEGLARALGEDGTARYLASGVEVPPLGLRVEDDAPGARDAWLERLRAGASGPMRFEAGHASPRAILAWHAGRPSSIEGWAAGALSVQEEGSQVIALALGARPGDVVLDACAGRGNKTALLAHDVAPGGSVDAADLHAAKLDALQRELGRLGRAPREAAAVDWSVGAGPFVGTYDRVLVDAPCSGTGTLRRRPDLQVRRKAEDLARLAALQTAIVTRAAERVRPGGALVYAVCSVLREEAEAVVEALLRARPELRPAPFPGEAARALAGEAPTLRLLPHLHGTDGYFLASFVRAADTDA